MLKRKIPDIIKEIARDLRKNQTKSEYILWNNIRYDKIGYRFLRQRPIFLYTENSGLDRFIIPDFYCDEKKIIIEVDGSIHNLNEVLILDLEKEKLLNNIGIKVLRIKNDDILNNISYVINKIKTYL